MSVRFSYSAVRTPPIPALDLTLHTPDGSRSLPGLVGLLDTAADCSVVPLPFVQHLGLQSVRQLQARGFGTPTVALDVYRLRIEVSGLVDLVVDVIGHSAERHVLVGRDVLNQFRVTFDGPNQVVEFH